MESRFEIELISVNTSLEMCAYVNTFLEMCAFPEWSLSADPPLSVYHEHHLNVPEMINISFNSHLCLLLSHSRLLTVVIVIVIINSIINIIISWHFL
jgi:hypothetical protein